MPAIVHLIVFSNFEGFAFDPAPVLTWFDAFKAAHPAVRWTHMYNPIYFLRPRPDYARVEAAFSPRLLADQSRSEAEVGVHIHMFYELIKLLGVEPRAFPFCDDTSPLADRQRTQAEDPRAQNGGQNGGYDVLFTAYMQAERERILDTCVHAFLDRGFRQPTSFCAGYSAADPALQALLADRGFRASFAAQALGPADYKPGWYRLLPWYGAISPLTIPYRVNRETILPPPHPGGEYLDLVEVPLNLACDKNELHDGERVVSRGSVFDQHFDWAREHGQETAVAIGVHADILGRETWQGGAIASVVDRLLQHASHRASEGGAKVVFSTASEVAARFWENRSMGVIPSPGVP